MTFFNRLCTETETEKQRFLNRDIIQKALTEGVSVELYRAYLEQAYHHVKFTCPLLGLSLAKTPVSDRFYRAALINYIDEEKGHEEWILDDIETLGGDKENVRHGEPNIPNKAMIGYLHYAIEYISPYAILGMVHVLEGISVDLAHKVASSIGQNIGKDASGKGFSYLRSHGALDIEHVAFFEKTVNQITSIETQDIIIENIKMIYRLWGDMFEEIDTSTQGERYAA